jgi:hypothetical protein
MPRKPAPRTLATIFLAVSAALSVAVLAVRNLYDDEISSLDVIVRPVAYILRRSAERDVHPPGMYLLAHFAYRILPSFRWMDLIPCLILYTGLAVFLLQITPLFSRTRSQLCLLLLATLHPQLLLWSASFRWYTAWTGLALIALTVALQPRNPRPSFGVARALILGLLLASLFYLNYVTFLFVIALAAAMLQRYPWKRLLPPTLLTLAVFAILAAPQFHTMLTVHLPDSVTQRSGLANSTLRLLESIAASEAYLPWHPLAILAALLFAALCMAGLIALLRLDREKVSLNSIASVSALTSILLFGLLFLLLVAVTGLGGKPRNGLLLVPILAPAAALILGTLRPCIQTAVLLFFVLWTAVGFAHIVGRYGLSKSTMIARPEQVVDFVRQSTGLGCAVVVTYDAPLAFSLDQADLPRLLIVSPFQEPAFGGLRNLPTGCAHTRLYTIQTYLPGTSLRETTLIQELRSSTQFIQGQPRTNSFSFDPDAPRKRSLSHISGLGADLAFAAQLPDYRYVVISGPIDPAAIPTMRNGMPDFLSGSNPDSGDDAATP